jgi:hypothetical protein
MNQKTFLVNFPTKTPYDLVKGFNFVEVNGVFCSYYTQSKNRKNAIKSAKRLLKMRLETQ